MTECRIKKLDSIRFLWDPLDESFERHVKALIRFKEEFGHTSVPCAYVSVDLKLGAWVVILRAYYKNGTISQERIARLESVGFPFILRHRITAWEKGFDELSQFKLIFGHTKVKDKYESNGFKLGYWVKTQRQNYKKGKLHQDLIDKLNTIGFVWVVGKGRSNG